MGIRRDMSIEAITARIDRGEALHPGDVAVLFNVTQKTVARWCQAEPGQTPKLESFKTLGGHHRIPALAIVEFQRASGARIYRGQQ